MENKRVALQDYARVFDQAQIASAASLMGEFIQKSIVDICTFRGRGEEIPNDEMLLVKQKYLEFKDFIDKVINE